MDINFVESNDRLSFRLGRYGIKFVTGYLFLFIIILGAPFAFLVTLLLGGLAWFNFLIIFFILLIINYFSSRYFMKGTEISLIGNELIRINNRGVVNNRIELSFSKNDIIISFLQPLLYW